MLLQNFKSDLQMVEEFENDFELFNEPKITAKVEAKKKDKRKAQIHPNFMIKL